MLSRKYIYRREVETRLIEKVEEYLKEKYNCELKAMDLNFLININKDDENVKLLSQCMNTPNGVMHN